MNLNERLQYALDKSGKTQADLSRACKVATSSVANWMNGRTKELSAIHAFKAAALLGVNPFWLATGEGEPTRGNVVEVFEGDATTDLISVPEFKILCGAGPGASPTFEEVSETKPSYYRHDFFAARGVKAQNCKRLKVHGDSMLPLLNDGDTILVDCTPHQRIRDGKVYVFCFEDEVRVKRLYSKISGDIVVRSENQSYGEEIINSSDLDRFFLIGKVIERSGSL